MRQALSSITSIPQHQFADDDLIKKQIMKIIIPRSIFRTKEVYPRKQKNELIFTIIRSKQMLVIATIKRRIKRKKKAT